MGFDYSKLLGKIKEKGLTQEALAKNIGITPGSMSEKLNNKAFFQAKGDRYDLPGTGYFHW